MARRYHAGQIVAVDDDGKVDESVKVYDISLTRNVVQMIFALALLVWIMITIAKRYQKGEGVKSAPKGIAKPAEPVINFVQDEVAKPNLGNKYRNIFLTFLPFSFLFLSII